MLTQNEQRDFIRMAVDAPVQVRVAQAAGVVTLAGRCRDLSATGLSLWLAEELAVGTTVQVHMESGGPAAALNATCEVMRVQQHDDGIEHGCTIVSFD